MQSAVPKPFGTYSEKSTFCSIRIKGSLQFCFARLNFSNTKATYESVYSCISSFVKGEIGSLLFLCSAVLSLCSHHAWATVPSSDALVDLFSNFDSSTALGVQLSHL